MANILKTHPKLYIIDNGRMKMDKNFMVAMHDPATIDEPNKPAVFTEFPIYTVLIDHPEGKILFDTSCNPNSMGNKGRWAEATQKTFPWEADEACYLPHRLEQLHVRPEDIKYVIASHLHLDHAGCLEMFTNAKIIVHEDELNGTLRSYADYNNSGAYIWADIDAWLKNHLQWKTVGRHEDNIPLAEGVRILNFGSGHAWGLIGLQIELPESGGIILASDAVYSAENYGPPIKIPGILYDSIGYVNAVKKIKKIAAETGSKVFYGHDAEQFQHFIKSTEGYYE